MKKVRQRIRDNRILFGSATVAACVALVFCVLFFINLLFFRVDVTDAENDIQERSSIWNRYLTTTDYRYDDEFHSTLLEYESFGEILDPSLSFAVPGLEKTNVLGQMTNQMIPQGICEAGDYILISAYNADSKLSLRYFRREIKNSVVYILDKKGTFLTSLVLPDVNHVGGITFDGSSVWLAKSTDRMISAIPYEEIQAAAKANSQSYMLTEYSQELDCGRTASFIQFHKGKLWIGTFRGEVAGSSEVGVYQLTSMGEEKKLTQIGSFQVPSCAQGMSFIDNDGREQVVIATSYGRHRSSTFYIYDLTRMNGEYLAEYAGECKMPPMTEEIYSDGEYTYMIFESASTLYSKNRLNHCEYPVDRVCVVDNSDLLTVMEYDDSSPWYEMLFDFDCWVKTVNTVGDPMEQTVWKKAMAAVSDQSSFERILARLSSGMGMYREVAALQDTTALKQVLRETGNLAALATLEPVEADNNSTEWSAADLSALEALMRGLTNPEAAAADLDTSEVTMQEMDESELPEQDTQIQEDGDSELTEQDLSPQDGDSEITDSEPQDPTNA